MTDVVKLNYSKQGEGPCVVICHGLYGSLANFTGLAKLLAQDYTVIRIDLRNHGGSLHVNSMAQTAMAADLAAVLEVEGIGRATIIGHSLGGKVAMQFAALYPDKTVGLVVADIAPVAYSLTAHDTVFTALQAVDLTRVNNRKEADAQLAEFLTEPQLRQFLLTNLQRGESGFQWRINLPVLVNEYAAIAAAPQLSEPFAGPVLVLRGSESDYVTEEGITAFAEFFPAADIHTIEQAGHWLHAEQPQLFAEYIVRFLAVVNT